MTTPLILIACVAFVAIATWLFFEWLSQFILGKPRAQAAAICYRWKEGEVRALEFLLVRTRNKRRWIFPKGAIESGETASEAAVRETREEAGIEGRVTGELDPFQFRGGAVSVWLLEVAPDAKPRTAERSSAWLELKEAKAALREKRPKQRSAPMLQALTAAHRHLVAQVRH